MVDSDIEELRRELLDRMDRVEDRVRADLSAYGERMQTMVSSLRSELVARDVGFAATEAAKWEAHVGENGVLEHLGDQRKEDITRVYTVLSLGAVVAAVVLGYVLMLH